MSISHTQALIQVIERLGRKGAAERLGIAPQRLDRLRRGYYAPGRKATPTACELAMLAEVIEELNDGENR